MLAYALGLDVGGTNIRAGIVSSEAKLIDHIQSSESPSQEFSDAIISSFLELATQVITQSKNQGINTTTCGIGMPGPFDYEKGISHMEHKFQAIKGINLKEIFEKELGIPVFFLNDASAFGLGVSWVEHPDKKKLLAITVGTGLGSSFIVDGHTGTREDHITQNGEIWNFPYKKGILEDYISKRAIEQSYKELTDTNEEVKTIADKARQGDTAALETFEKLAQELGEGLALSVTKFHPEIVVVGGKIGAHAFDLFGRRAQEVYTQRAGYAAKFVPTTNEYLAIFGAAYFGLTNLQ